ncbi:MAG: winged helix-turn-helix domain-containing protein [Pseudomonadota bacterium]
MSNKDALIPVREQVWLDLERQSLFAEGKAIHLRPKSYEVLRVLVENAGKVVSKDELIRAVWGDTPASDDSLTHCLIDIRKALKDHDRTIVRTVPRRGYLFEAPAVAAKAETSRSHYSLTLVMVCVLALVIAGALFWHLTSTPIGPPETRQTGVAVMPFVDMSEAQDQQFLGEGFAEEILNVLAQSPGLRVVARTSSFSFKGDAVDIATIGERLNVTHVLEGSVRRTGDRLRITAQLIDASDSAHIWSESYDKKVGDIFEIQSEIAESVAASLAAALSTSTGKPSGDPYAHTLVIQARGLLHSRNSETLPVAKALLHRALALDPDNVAAINQLARAEFYTPDPVTGEQRTERMWIESGKYGHRALAIDPDDITANAYAAFRKMYYEHDFVGAARQFEQVSAAEPANLELLRQLQSASLVFKKLEDGARISDMLLDRDPHCLPCSWLSFHIHLRLGEYVKAKLAADQFLFVNPDNIGPYHYAIGTLRLAEGDPAGALETFERIPDDPLSLFGDTLPLFGKVVALHRLDRPEFETALSEFLAVESTRSPSYNHPYAAARLMAALGEDDQAFEWLERSRDIPIWGFELSYGDVFFYGLHDDPRWDEHMAEVGLSASDLDRINFQPTLPQSYRR